MSLGEFDHWRQPRRGLLRGLSENRTRLHPPDLRDFRRVRTRLFVDLTDQDVIELVFDESGALAGRAIDKRADVCQSTVDAELLPQARPGSGDELFPGPRMAAAGVRPGAGEVVFRERPSLQQRATVRPIEHDREREMEVPGRFVRSELRRLPDDAAVFCNKNDGVTRRRHSIVIRLMCCDADPLT